MNPLRRAVLRRVLFVPPVLLGLALATSVLRAAEPADYVFFTLAPGPLGDAALGTPRTLALRVDDRVLAAGENDSVIVTANARGTQATVATASAGGFLALATDSAHPGFAATRAHTIVRLDPCGDTTLCAGTPGQPGFADGPALAARFRGPTGLALTPDGSLFIADTANHIIRRLSPDGIVSTFCGQPGRPGSADGPAASATFHYPSALALAPDGTLFVADSASHTIRRIAPDGTASTLAGAPGLSGATDGFGPDARFCLPEGLALDASGNLFVADTGNHTLRLIAPSGHVSTLAGLAGIGGSADCPGADTRFVAPYAVAVTAHDSVFVADTGNRLLRLGLPRAALLDAYFDFITTAGLDPAATGAPAADPDHDGLPNLLEFALGADPNTPDSALLPTLVPAAGAPTRLTYTFTTPLAPDDPALQVEFTRDLTRWFPATLPDFDLQSTLLEPGRYLRTVTFPAFPTALFLRLKVQR